MHCRCVDAFLMFLQTLGRGSVALNMTGSMISISCRKYQVSLQLRRTGGGGGGGVGRGGGSLEMQLDRAVCSLGSSHQILAHFSVFLCKGIRFTLQMWLVKADAILRQRKNCYYDNHGDQI